MQLMKEGSKWELYIPSELGYGDRGAGGRIPGGKQNPIAVWCNDNTRKGIALKTIDLTRH